MAVGDAEGIRLKITGDSSSGVQSVKQFRDELKNTEKAMKENISVAQEFARNLGVSGEQYAVLSKNLSQFKTGLSAVGTVATYATGAIVAVGAAAAATTAALFALSKQAADYGSEIHDASDKTGLHAETLTAIKFAAEQAGASFEQAVKGIVLFGAEVGKAAEGDDKAAAKMKLLGVTTTETRGALAEAIKTIYEARTNTEQLSLASEAFGRRIGPDLIPLIKDAHGNLDALEKKAKELGITMTDETAAAADEFGDQLDQLETQIGGVARTIGFTFMPVFKDMAQYVSNWLVENQGEIKAWADRTKVYLAGASSYWSDYWKDARIAGQLYFEWLAEQRKALGPLGEPVPGNQQSSGTGFTSDILEKIRKRGEEELKRAQRGEAGLTNRERNLDLSDTAKKTAKKTVADGIEDFFHSIGFERGAGHSKLRPPGTEVEGKPGVISKHSTGEALDVRTKTKTTEEIVAAIAAALEKGFRIYDERLHVDKSGTPQPHLHVEANTLKPSTFYGNPALYGGAENLAALKKLDAERIAKKGGSGILDKTVEEFRKEAEEKKKLGIDTAREVYEYEKSLAEKQMRENLARFTAESKTRIASVEAALEDKSITQQQAVEQKQQIRLDQLKEELRYVSDINSVLYDENKASTTQEDINTQLLDDYREQLKVQKDLRDSLNDFIEQQQKSFDLAVQNNSQSVSGNLPGQLQFDPETGLFEMVKATDELTEAQQRLQDANDALSESWKRLSAEMEDAGNVQMAQIDISQQGLDLIGNMENALERAIENWLLYGESVGKALKQALAAELAHVAARCAIKAIEATADGFFFLATGQHAAAVAAFTAAAYYAAVAVAAGVAAKALAPKQQAKPAGGAAGAAASQGTGSRSNSGGQYYSHYGDDATVLNVGRNAPETVTHRVQVELSLREDGVLQIFHKDVKNNGPMRGLILDVAAAA